MPVTREARFVRATSEEIYAVAHVLGKVTKRQLRGMGLDAAGRAACDRLHEAFVRVLEEDADFGPLQLVLRVDAAD